MELNAFRNNKSHIGVCRAESITVTMTISLPAPPPNSPVNLPANPVLSTAPISAELPAIIQNEPTSTPPRAAGSSAATRLRKLWQPSLADLLVARGLPRPGAAAQWSDADQRAIRTALTQLDTLTPGRGIGAELAHNAGHDLLKSAVVCGDAQAFYAVCTLLRQRVISANTVDGNDDTLLHAIARNGVLPSDAASQPDAASITLTDRIDQLVQLGADTNLRNAQNAWPLTLAWQRNTPQGDEVAQALRAAGFDPLHKDSQGWSMIDKAAASGDVSSLRGWVASGGSPDVRSARRNETLLMLAAAANQTDSIEQLIESGADIHAVDKLGLMAIHLAVNRRAEEALDILLQHGADPLGRSRDGSTPYAVSPLSSAARYAAMTGDDNLLQKLLAKGADPDYRALESTPSARELFALNSDGREFPRGW